MRSGNWRVSPCWRLMGLGVSMKPSGLCGAIVMAASRHIPAYVQKQIDGKWQQSRPLGLGRTLHGLTFGIWGYGKIGRRVAQFAAIFGMKMLGWGSEGSRKAAGADGVETTQDKASFSHQADGLSLHLRLNAATKGCVILEDLALMKPDSLFVNISRADLVEEDALFTALKQVPTKSRPSTSTNEPIRDAANPRLSLPNVLCSPHIGYVEQNSFKAAIENAVNFLEGRPTHSASPELLLEWRDAKQALALKDLPYGGRQLLRIGDIKTLQGRAGRHRDIRPGDPPQGGFQAVKGLLHHHGCHFARKTAGARGLVKHDQAPCFAHRCQKRFPVQRDQGAQIHDFHADTLGGHLLGRL